MIGNITQGVTSTIMIVIEEGILNPLIAIAGTPTTTGPEITATTDPENHHATTKVAPMTIMATVPHGIAHHLPRMKGTYCMITMVAPAVENSTLTTETAHARTGQTCATIGP